MVEWEHGAERELRLGRLPRGAARGGQRAGHGDPPAWATSTRRSPGGASVVEAEYHVPHLAHAPMEPPAASRASTRSRARSGRRRRTRRPRRRRSRRRSGLAPTQVTVHVTFLGGGFGRKSKPDFVVEAALLSRAVGRAGARAVDARGRHPARLLPRHRRAAPRGRPRRASRSSSPGATASRPRRSAPPSIVKADRLSGWELQALNDLPLERGQPCASRAARPRRTCASAGCARSTTSTTLRRAELHRRDRRRDGPRPEGDAARRARPRPQAHGARGRREGADERARRLHARRRPPAPRDRARDGALRLGRGPPRRARGRARRHRSFLTYVAVVVAVSFDAKSSSGSTRSGSWPIPARWSTRTACARSSRARSSSA